MNNTDGQVNNAGKLHAKKIGTGCAPVPARLEKYHKKLVYSPEPATLLPHMALDPHIAELPHMADEPHMAL
jgi:hypothetical protein